MPRYLKSGYSIGTLKVRLEDLICEVKLMGEDGRMELDDSIELMTYLAKAQSKVYHIRFKSTEKGRLSV